ncbi:MAG: YueI family protein [Peptococcaceae bacterium]
MDKSELEKALARGIYGTPELKRAEKQKFLGTFRERVLKVLTKKQVIQRGTYKEILEALKDPRAGKLIITNDVQMSEAMEYILMAKHNQVEFTMVDGHDYQGDIGLVVAAGTAIDVEDIYV